MTLANFVFQPSVLTVVAGDSVTFTNVGGFHNAICEQGDPLCGAFPSPTLAPWSTNLTFSTPGTYFYRCTVHSPDFRSGMVATVIVRPPPESILPATISDAHLDAGNIVFSVRGTPALSQVVEGSPDLGQWLPLSTNNSASGLFSYTNALGQRGLLGHRVSDVVLPIVGRSDRNFRVTLRSCAAPQTYVRSD